MSVRVEYLSRALMCLSSCEMNTASNYSDFMLHLEEKKEVARVQLMVSGVVKILTSRYAVMGCGFGMWIL